MSKADSRTAIYYDEVLIMRLARRYHPESLKLLIPQLSSAENQSSSAYHQPLENQLSSARIITDDILSSVPTHPLEHG